MARPRRNFYRRASKRKPPPRSFKVICSGCGKELMMEVPAPVGKDLLCLDCYNK
jgi:formylmethanofuran dehydrogenase subunit E